MTESDEPPPVAPSAEPTPVAPSAEPTPVAPSAEPTPVAPVAIADTSGLLAYFDRSEPEHAACRRAMATLSHAVISPLVLAELDYLLTTGIGASAAEQALDFIIGQTAIRRFEVPEVGSELAAAQVVMRRYREIGLTDAVTVVLAATFRTTTVLTLDRRHFRALRPLSGASHFRLLPHDL